MSMPNSYDAYAPAQIARRVEAAGIAKAELALLPLVTLALLAGAFIAFGAMLYTLVMTDAGLGFGLARWIGGIAFSLGLVLVVVGGAELFTGNSLIVMACADGKVGVGALLRNWLVVYVGNFAGAAATAAMVWLSGTLAGADVGVAGLVANLVPVTIGNVIGGGVFVALVYWIVYVRGSGPAL